MSSNLKSMASLAKERLKRGLYTNAEKAKAKNAMTVNSYFVKNFNSFKKINSKATFVSITNEIDEDFVSKVYKILNSPVEIYNPIGLLIDNNVFSELTDVEKQFYVLNVVDKYNKIKNEYNLNLKSKIS